MDHNSSRKSNKISDIVRLHQLLKKWKKLANNSSKNTNNNNTTSGTKSINKFLKKTLSFSEKSSTQESNVVPKGYISVCVGNELKRFTIPTEYLSHRAFAILLREAEEEFGFQQEGVLKFPCEVQVFEKVLKMMGDNRKFSSSRSADDHQLFLNVVDDDDNEQEEYCIGSVNGSIHRDNSVISCDSVHELTTSHRQNHTQMMCR